MSNENSSIPQRVRLMRMYDDRKSVNPDWDSVRIETLTAPWNDAMMTVQATFEDPVLHGYRALIIEDTIDDPNHDSSGDLITPDRITTMAVRYPRIVLPEFNTHRVFSRNSASSRARSIRATIEPVMSDPFIPLWTQNQRGMSGKYASSARASNATLQWLKARDSAVASLLSLLTNKNLPDSREVSRWWESCVSRYQTAYKNDDIPDQWLSIHKQDANRLIEPWMWHETLVTSTYWKNFYDLRISDGAQPEIRAIAVLMRAVMRASVEHSVLRESIIHAPFITIADEDIVPNGAGNAPDGTVRIGDWDSLESVLLESASECARISYTNKTADTDGNNAGRNPNTSGKHGNDLGRKLLESKHMSPFEHIAWSTRRADEVPALLELLSDVHDRDMTSNLSPQWTQFRRALSAREQ